MPLILGTNSIKDTGYNVANSLRVDRNSSAYLTRNESQDQSDGKKITISIIILIFLTASQYFANLTL